jgi:hypothetical protein
MKSERKLNAQDLLTTESEILKRIANEVIDSDVAEIVSGHQSTTGGHRSGSTHTSHSSAMREKINKKD